MKKIPLVDLKTQYQNLREEILEKVDGLFSETAFIGGRYVADFEKAFADFCGVKHAVGVANGTEALHVALRALDIGQGDEVILPAHTFVATSEAVRLVGATPVFVDVLESSMLIDVAAVEKAITPKTKAIIPVHLYGYCADMPALEKLASDHDLILLCDTAQAHGAKLNNKPISQYGLLSTYSFYPGKNLGAFGDAGAIVTNDDELADKLKQFKDHGRSEKYTHNTLGTNARMDALQALILSIKLPHLAGWCEKRRQVAAWYQQKLAGLSGIILPTLGGDDMEPVFHLYVIRVASAERDALLQYLHEKNIGAGVHYPLPLHLQPCNADLPYSEGSFPVTEKLCHEIISLPIYPEITEDQVDYVCNQLKAYFQHQSSEGEHVSNENIAG